MIEAGDHSFKIPQRSWQGTERQVWDEIVGVVLSVWLSLAAPAGGAPTRERITPLRANFANGAPRRGRMSVLAGTSGYSYKEWLGHFY